MHWLKRLFGKKETAYLSPEEMEAISAHWGRFAAPTPIVFHEKRSELLHIDVHITEPFGDPGQRLLYTTGMSALPMPGGEFAELGIVIPEEWPLDPDSLRNPEHFWVVRWLKMMTRMPWMLGRPLEAGLSIPNGDPAEALPGTRFEAILLCPPAIFPAEAATLQIGTKRTQFFFLAPITRSEVEWKIQQEDGEALFRHLQASGINLRDLILVNPDRPDLVA